MALTAVLGGFAMVVPAASAATMSGATITLSDNEASTNPVTTATWSWSFVSATTATITSVDLQFNSLAAPDGTPPADLGQVYGLGAGTLSWNSASGEFVYTVTSPVSVAAGVPILIQTENVPNPPNVDAGTWQATITTNNSSGAVDTGTADYTIVSGMVTMTTVVPQATSLSVAGQGIYAGPSPAFEAVVPPGIGVIWPLTVGPGDVTSSKV